MIDTPNPESTVATDAKPKKPLLDLAALYPACFNWKQPRPLKIGIREDLLAAGHDQKKSIALWRNTAPIGAI
jgi:sRNA-binding protein